MAHYFSTIFNHVGSFGKMRGCQVLFILFWVSAASSVASADEISFDESYAEQVVNTDIGNEVAGTGLSTVLISLPWNGVNPESFDGSTEINISIGDFQFVHVLAESSDYQDGDRRARFLETDVDSSGREFTNSLFNAIWTDKVFTISGTIRNLNQGIFENYFGAKNYLGKNGPIHGTYFAQIRFGDFSVTNVSIAVIGRNAVTHTTVGGEPFTLNSVHISGAAALPPADKIAPTVKITSPVANGRLLMPQITGTASDNRAVTDVFFRVGEDAFARATGTTNWTADATLIPGTNVVQVKSEDIYGNESPILTRTFFYVVPSPLTVEINGDGTTSLTNGQLLELTRAYSITARPAASNVFVEWLGTINSTNPTLTFVMEPDFLLQPFFVPNPFIPAATGSYSGLFSNPNNVAPTNSGFFTATVKSSGSFSGKILIGNSRHSFTGNFDLAGRATKIILRPNKPSLNVNLQLDFSGGLRGSIEQGGETSDLEAEVAQSSTNSARRIFTLLIPPGENPSMAPGGYGFGSASVDLKGRLRFAGTLGEGSHISQGAQVSASGRWPLFASLHRGKGVLSGWLTFADEPGTDVRGDSVIWVESPSATRKLYTNGFSVAGPVVGSLYSVPPVATPWLNWDFGSLELSGGNLSTPQTNAVTRSPDNNLIVDSTNRTSLHIIRPRGLLRGSFIHPESGQPAALRGALLQKQQFGAGFFRGSNESGSFVLQSNLSTAISN